MEIRHLVQFRILKSFRIPSFRCRIPRRRGGFTIIETVVALVVVVAAMTGPFTLATRSIFSAKFAKSRLIALNLAQEGVELIRGYRENNLATGQTWDAGIGGGLGTATNWQADIVCQASPCTVANAPNFSACSGPCAFLRYNSATGLYTLSDGVDSMYQRTITIDRRSASQGNPHYDASVPQADQMRVMSRVDWSESGIARSVSVEEVFYNWR